MQLMMPYCIEFII